jgi:hypothetical protein
MPSLAKGQPNTAAGLNWYVSPGGVLTDADEIGFQILDMTEGSPGVQVFPETAGEWADVTEAPGHFGLGSYYAYDDELETGWTPEGSLGAHRIKWRWRTEAGLEYQSASEDFDVVAGGVGNSIDTYVTVQDIRRFGVTSEIMPDNEVLDAIKESQQLIERATRQWFTPREVTLVMDGNGLDILHLPVPIVGITSMKINGSEYALDPAYYHAYTGRLLPDDRKNPKIVLTPNGRGTGSVIYSSGSMSKFERGRRNQTIVGTFGYVEEDGTTPMAIKRAVRKMVLERVNMPIQYLGGTGEVETVAGVIIEEETDGHRRKYAQGSVAAISAKRRVGLMGLTQDPEVLETLRLYKGPQAISAVRGGYDVAFRYTYV